MDKLYRSRSNRWLLGVCGGLAEYFNVDAALVRLLWALATLVWGAGILAYIIAAIVIPDGDGNSFFKAGDQGHSSQARRNAGVLLICAGVIFLIIQITPWHMLRYFWPVLLIAVGVLFLVRHGKD
jgi:phage shock protein PspC (stress-responsive transcriptional regulator)